MWGDNPKNHSSNQAVRCDYYLFAKEEVKIWIGSLKCPIHRYCGQPTVMLKAHSLQSGPANWWVVQNQIYQCQQGPLHSRVRQLGVRIRSHPHSRGYSTPKQNWGPSIRAACGYIAYSLHTQMHTGTHTDIFRSDPSAKAGYSEGF